MASIKTKILNTISLLPNSINHCLLALNKDPVRVYGNRYGAYSVFLRDSELQYDPLPKLFESVNDAIGRVPYYRQRYGERKISSLAEFEERIGFIDKETILANYQEFMADGIDLSSYDHGTTGGTSGKPLQLIAPRDRYVVEMATMHSLWGRASYRFDVRGVIRNKRLNDGQVYRINPITREVIFDGFRLNNNYFSQIYETITKHSIRFIHCYPSTAYEFSTFMLEKQLDTSGITAFLSGSENIFDYQRELIQGRLGIRFYNWYGHSEKLVLAGYCAGSDNYHVEPTYGYFELVDETGKVVREPGAMGEIVGTSFHNPGMPFIRYRTGDFAEYVGDYCPFCGRHLPLIRNIRGRWSGDRIYNADGTFVTTTALNLHNDLYQVINGMQYLQERKGELSVLIVKSPVYNEAHEKALYAHFQGKLNADTSVSIRYVDRLLRKPNGKFVHIISTVSP
ncbi:MAG: phenylacetate--CoA ligase family protein [Chlorobium sp.]|nr:phenylacetate--CoA ligase family protein [Chlorobium sp.]